MANRNIRGKLLPYIYAQPEYKRRLEQQREALTSAFATSRDLNFESLDILAPNLSLDQINAIGERGRRR